MIEVKVLDRFLVFQSNNDTSPKEGCIAILLDKETGAIALLETIDGLASNRIDFNAVALGELKDWLNQHFCEEENG